MRLIISGYFEGPGRGDAFLNAAMLLGGMRERKEDRLLDKPMPTRFDREEWELRTVDTERLAKRLGRLAPDTLATVLVRDLLWWSALSAGVAAGLLELGEWLAFLRAKAFQKATEQPAGAEEGPKT